VERRQKIKRQSPQDKGDFIYGTRVVLEAIDAGKEIEKVLIQKDLRNDLIKQLIAKLNKLNIPFAQVPIEKLNRLTRKNHQGVVSYISPIRYQSLDNIIESVYASGKDPFLVILDRVTDVRNFGAIARTMECAGADALVIQNKGNALIGADAMKTSAGALNILPVCREQNLKHTINGLKASGIRIIGCTEKTENLIYKADLTGPIAIILGSEENGISGEYLKLCDDKAKIPMSGKIESLNVSVSAGIAIYEAVRQRDKD
jgi:23S rRNA (guanosine2251-2'-O)-methyltransferase